MNVTGLIVRMSAWLPSHLMEYPGSQARVGLVFSPFSCFPPVRGICVSWFADGSLGAGLGTLVGAVLLLGAEAASLK